MSMSTKQRDLLSRMKAASRTIQSSEGAAVHAVRAEDEYLDAVEADHLLPPGQKVAARNARREQTAAKLTDLKVEVERARHDYAEALDLLTHAPHEMSSFGAVDRQLAWERLRDQLDQLPEKASKFQKAQELLERASKMDDRATLQAAYMQLGSYLEARGEVIPEEHRLWLAKEGGPECAFEAIVIDINERSANYRCGMGFDMVERGHRDLKLPDVIPARREGDVIAVIPSKSTFDPKEAPQVRNVVDVAGVSGQAV